MQALVEDGVNFLIYGIRTAIYEWPSALCQANGGHFEYFSLFSISVIKLAIFFQIKPLIKMYMLNTLYRYVCWD